MHFAATHAGTSLIVHSHLRWDFVWQRPQQLLSRLSAQWPVLFVEEPVYADDITTPQLELTEPNARVHRAVPRLPARLQGQYDHSIAIIRDLVRATIQSNSELGNRFANPVQWFYTPMPAPAMVGAFNERAVVYDCMDELSKFRFAPAELIDREAYLMAEADVVFAGGYSLAQSKAKRHSNVHFFGCGVDVAHFAKASADATVVPNDIVQLTRPVAGYYGVIDERIDYDLLQTLATELPHVSFAMIGPVVKVDPSELPQLSNIHWLGQRDYAELPGCVKGFDVCLMPFALNEATEYINPTKTLEYMAAGKPIVSSAVPDVVHNFTPVVAIANSASDFTDAVRRAIDTPNAALVALGLTQARTNSWESIVGRMQRLIGDVITTRRQDTARNVRMLHKSPVHADTRLKHAEAHSLMREASGG